MDWLVKDLELSNYSDIPSLFDKDGTAYKIFGDEPATLIFIHGFGMFWDILGQFMAFFNAVGRFATFWDAYGTFWNIF